MILSLVSPWSNDPVVGVPLDVGPVTASGKKSVSRGETEEMKSWQRDSSVGQLEV